MYDISGKKDYRKIRNFLTRFLNSRIQKIFIEIKFVKKKLNES